MTCLTVLDALGVQDYVFGSGRLRDAAGASQLVIQATGRTDDGALAAARVGESDLVQAAGGVVVLTSESELVARDRVARLTRDLQSRAPGLELVAVHQPVDGENIAGALLAAHDELLYRKLRRLPDVAQDGMSVTASCAETGLPAGERVTGTPEALALLSPRVGAVRRLTVPRQGGRARDPMWDVILDKAVEERLAPELRGYGFELPLDLERLGRTRGTRSLIAVVHVDGNSVGASIASWLAKQTGDVRRHMQEWSSDLEALGRSAGRAVIDTTVAALGPSQDGDGVALTGGRPPDDALAFPLSRAQRRGALPLPVRPVLLGGDDLTFVCDGRIGLSLAVAALRAFAGREVRHLGDTGPLRVGACAGVAVVPVGAPFPLAYELAERLCQSAKRLARDELDGGSAIDWHVGMPRPGLSIKDLRARQYAGAADRPSEPRPWTLTRRPYPLEGEPASLPFAWLEDVLLDGDEHGLRAGRAERPLGSPTRAVQSAWVGRRNKVKQLARLVRGGPDSVGEEVGAWKRDAERDPDAPPLGFPDPLDQLRGVLPGDGRTPVLDALELLDLHLPLTAA